MRSRKISEMTDQELYEKTQCANLETLYRLSQDNKWFVPKYVVRPFLFSMGFMALMVCICINFL